MVNESPVAAAFATHHNEEYEEDEIVTKSIAAEMYMQYRNTYFPPPERSFNNMLMESFDQFKVRFNSDRPPNASIGGTKADGPS